MNGLTFIIERKLNEKLNLNDNTVLSLGCGIGITESNFLCKSIEGVDIFDYSKNHFLSNREYKKGKFIIGDILKIKEIMKEKSYDVVLNLDIIEHLEKADGFKLIEDAESIATKAVVFYTPIKWDTNEKAVNNPSMWSYGNKYNIHKSLWREEEFIERGYSIYKEYPAKDSVEGFIAIKFL